MQGAKKFLDFFTRGDVETASAVMWTKDLEMKKQMVAQYERLRPVLPRIGKRRHEYFIGATMVGEFWLEVAYIEVFDGTVMFVKFDFARPVDENWYVKGIDYTVNGDISKLIEQIPGEYKRFISSESEVSKPSGYQGVSAEPAGRTEPGDVGAAHDGKAMTPGR